MNDLSEEEIKLIKDLREQKLEKIPLGEINVEDEETPPLTYREILENKELEELVDDAIKDVSKQTILDRMTRLENSYNAVLEISDNLDTMMQKFLKKKEEDIKLHQERSNQNIKILKEIHELRIHVDTLKPKIGVLFWGASVAVGLVVTTIFPKIAPFVLEIVNILK